MGKIKRIIFASQNQGKVREMKAILRDLKIEVLGASEIGIKEEAVEDQVTFEANALKKAQLIAQLSKEWSVADDSGLGIKALGGRPGVYSARWAGPGASAEELVNYTLEQIKTVPPVERQAWFETAVALVTPTRESWIFKSRIEGEIVKSPRGQPRPKLPYDVIFRPQGYDRTFAEMTDEEKNSLSHRGLAFRQLRDFIAKFL